MAAAKQKKDAAAAVAKLEGGLASAVAEHEAKLAAARQERMEADCLRKEAEDRVSFRGDDGDGGGGGGAVGLGAAVGACVVFSSCVGFIVSPEKV